MKFTRLRLHGFKSFCDHTELHLEPGLTGVVGPNGCGKSNLVEALRWVMGESSYKAMRASGMDEVIFSGSGNRPGRNSAEVTLVLDNSDRTAPAPLNTADVLEVTRRIEREEGSVYRVNGREVRARDVQLLFADASTGAHSPALVRQGQIGELIAAKPVQRRALLEEAAGISGLHSRRHEAELRLRAAEQNLERVDDVIAQIEQQLEQLRRQARLAIRYRALSGDIRKAEATLFHIRWVGARFAEKEAEAEQGRLTLQLADAMHVEREAQNQVEAAELALQPLRDREAAAGAVLQRLTILSEQLADEARRAAQRRQELEDRLVQLDSDARRERELIAEADDAIARYGREREQLHTEAGAEAEALTVATATSAAALERVGAAETAARAAQDALAEIRAQRAQAQRAASEAAVRVLRLTKQIADVERDAAALARSLEVSSGVEDKRAALKAKQAAAGVASEAALAAEEASMQAQAALDAARPSLQETESALSRLEAESQTLARLLNTRSAGLWPAVADALQVTPGYETALGAALGDDLEASGDAGAPLHWSGPLPAEGDPGLPAGAEPLARYVSGSDLLTRRLNQIGLVARQDGPRLQILLTPGQRLVSREGDFWRWDGFVAAADAPSAAAQRLAQRNRLGELESEIESLRRERNSRRAEVESLATELGAARGREKAARDSWRGAQQEIDIARQALDSAQREIGELVARRGALEEARIRLGSSLAEAEAVKSDAERALAEAGGEAVSAGVAEEAQKQLAQLREAYEQARLSLGALESAARARNGRIAQLDAEAAGWRRRRDGSATQLIRLDQRAQELAVQLESLADAPESFEQRRLLLDDEIERARAAYTAAANALSTAQSVHREADKAQRLAGEAVSGAREQLVRIEERMKGLITQRHQIERQVTETLGIDAEQTAQAAGIRPAEALPPEPATAQKVERLKAERERLGGVNLTAERESAEVRERLDTMVKDRDDLIAAIAKLRGGIQSLNREGRHRLSEAFDKVNGHFRELFTSLFGGGTAELQFVESDDPLEAGLEIIARPPGKKPTTMTLLSGGEQALTALSLIFAVFLTNPAPICVLDEVDAPLDDHNVERFCTLLDSMCARTDTRFLVITHNPITMSRVDRLFGVTMAERGVSQLVSVDLTGAQEVRLAS